MLVERSVRSTRGSHEIDPLGGSASRHTLGPEGGAAHGGTRMAQAFLQLRQLVGRRRRDDMQARAVYSGSDGGRVGVDGKRVQRDEKRSSDSSGKKSASERGRVCKLRMRQSAHHQHEQKLRLPLKVYVTFTRFTIASSLAAEHLFHDYLQHACLRVRRKPFRRRVAYISRLDSRYWCPLFNTSSIPALNTFLALATYIRLVWLSNS